MNDTQIEAAILTFALQSLLSQGLSVRVLDTSMEGSSTSLPTILSHCFARDEEVLTVYNDGTRIGWVQFVWGNGIDCFADYRDTPELNAALEPTAQFIQALEEAVA